jgi:hypothetical protein
MSAIAKIVICLFIACAAVWAQGSTSQINGTVRDSSGLAVPGATVKVTQTATGGVRTVTSSADGAFVLLNLPIGPYLLEVTKDGFSKYAQSGIVLQVDSNPTIDATLKVGSVSEQVLVQADAAMVETHSTGVGQVVDAQRVAEMPLNGRNSIELVFLAGMASTAGGSTNLNSVRNYPTVIVSVAGGQGNGITYLLDGASHQDPYNSASLPLPFPDALQEFKVETSALPAQYGYHSGAAVNAVTKSGTNEFHGDLFEFLRNGDLNARDFFAATRDTYKRNQFGGVVGGPVRKDKLFFFGGYQRTSLRSDPSQLTAFVPTAAMVGGDFTAFASTRCRAVPVTLNPARGFVNNQISPALLNEVTRNLQKTLPQTADPCGRTSYGFVANQDENLWVAKVDWQQSQRNSIFGRFVLADLTVGSTYDGKNPLSVNTYGVHDLDYSLALGDTYLIGTGIVSSFRVAANRTNIPKVSDNYKSWHDLGSIMSDQGEHVMNLTVTGAFTIGGGAAVPGQSHNGPNPSLNEDLSVVKGAHQLGFGGGWLHQGMNYWSGLVMVGATTFDGSVTGLPLADLLYGQASLFSQGLRYGYYIRQNYTSLYAQDSWKLTPRLTVNYGLRWEPFTAVYNKFGQYDHFDPTLFAQNFHSSIFKNAPAGLAFPGEPQYPCGNSIHCPVWNKFFPRIGMVWDPKGDGRMTIRAAYGMFGDRNHMFFYTFMPQYAPFANNISLPNVNIANPWATYPGGGGDPIPALSANNGIGHADPNGAFPLAAQQVVHPLQGYHPPYLNQWNLSVQRQFGTDWLVTVNYLGNSTIHLQSSNLLNPAVLVPNTAGTPLGTCPPGVVGGCNSTGNQNQRRVLYLQNPAEGKYYSGIGITDDGGTGTYDALLLSAQKRLSHGINVLANYTWAHCISDVFESQTSATASPSIPGDRRRYRGNCFSSDLRQLLNLSFVATTPKFSNRALRILASNWQVAPIVGIKSAQFFNVTSGTDVALTTAPMQTPNLLNTNPYPSNQSVNSWVSRSAFAPAAPGAYGNLGLNNLKGPGVFQLNMALSRTFPLQEKRTIQVRAEAFNLPNHLNPAVPGSGSPITTPLNAGNFGQITSDISGNNGLNPGDYRIIQLAMKFVF